MTKYTLKLSCDDRLGIVADVSSFLAASGCNIVEAQQFDDVESGRFFMRVEFVATSLVEDIRSGFGDTARQHQMDWTLHPSDRRQRVVILVSKFDHCLVDLMYRARIGELNMDVVAIVSNHPGEALHLNSDELARFHHVSITTDTKPQQEVVLREIIEAADTDLVVLARYMQILSNEFATSLGGRCINIHHSFLPGFKGARPYHQAHSRGVKMIGATAHYVTGDLDEGPIIAQDVEPVTHADTPKGLVRKGRDIERRVLARAVAHHLEDRVFVNGNKTVVFQN
jgi:formyltetrahydrofolate deformylase